MRISFSQVWLAFVTSIAWATFIELETSNFDWVVLHFCLVFPVCMLLLAFYNYVIEDQEIYMSKDKAKIAEIIRNKEIEKAKEIARKSAREEKERPGTPYTEKLTELRKLTFI